MRLQLVYMLLLAIVPLFSYSQSDVEAIDSIVKDTVRDPVIVNFFAGYYEQDGVNSPVTGGIGDERLHDYIGKVSITVPFKTKKNNSLDLNMMGGVDYYTSASTDNINNEFGWDVKETSASYDDTRGYADLGVTYNHTKSKSSVGGNVGFSSDWDVNSISAGAFVTKLSRNENSQFRLGFLTFIDKWDLIYPLELRPADGSELLDVDVKQLYDVNFTYSQVLTKRIKASITGEFVYQKGLLSTPFHRVYFTDTSGYIEVLPKERIKVPLGLHANFYLADFLILRAFYRFYWDSWGIIGNTVQLELPFKIAKPMRFGPFYRFHHQTGADYFAPFAQHELTATYYTSDFDLSALTAHSVGLELKYSPVFGFLNNPNKYNPKSFIRFNKLSIRASKYWRFVDSTNTLKAFSCYLNVVFSV